MCNPLKAIKKVFRKVVKVVKKVAPVALAVAAIYFTVGNVLNIPGTAGGWGQAVEEIVGKMGATGLLSQTLIGAVQSAGYSAALGAGLNLITGEDPLKGAQTGAVVGAVGGGLLGAAGVNTDPFAPSEAPNAVQEPSLSLGGAADEAGKKVAAKGGGLLGEGGFIERNQTLVGGVVSGVGAGISGLAEAEGTRDAARITQETKENDRRAIAGNFSGSGAGLLTPASGAFIGDQPPRPTPTQQFQPTSRSFSGGRWVFNPQKGMIEFVSTA